MHSGNASGIDRKRGIVLIKPSGMDYDRMKPADMVMTDLEGRKLKGKWNPSVDLPEHLYIYNHCPEVDRKRVVFRSMDYDRMKPADMVMTDLEGRKLKGKWNPSVDLPEHLYIYNHCPEVGGVIHTHSNYATAMGLLGKPIPAYLTAIADEFGDVIPCAPYVDNQKDHIGQAILKYKNDKAPAIIMDNHGTFAWGPTPRAALKAAVMLEDVSKTVHLALQLGKPKSLPPEEVKKWWDRYHTWYGQPGKKH